MYNNNALTRRQALLVNERNSLKELSDVDPKNFMHNV